MHCSAYQLLRPVLSSEATTPTPFPPPSHERGPWEGSQGSEMPAEPRQKKPVERSLTCLNNEHVPGLKPRLDVGCSNPPHSSGAWQCRPWGGCSGAGDTDHCRCTSSRSGAPHFPSGAPPPWRWRRRRPGPSWQSPCRCKTFPYTRSTKVPRRMTGILSAPRVHFSFAPWALSVCCWGHLCIFLEAWHVSPSPLKVVLIFRFCIAERERSEGLEFRPCTGGRVGWSDLVVDIGVLGPDYCLDLPRLGQPCLGVVVLALLNSTMSLRMIRSGCWRHAPGSHNSCKWQQTQWSPWGSVAGYSSWNIINKTSFLNIILIWPWMGGTHPRRSWCHPRAPSGPCSAKFPPSCGCWQPTRRGRTRAQGQSCYRHGRLDQDVKTLTTILILSFVNYSCTWSSFWFRLFLSNFQRLGDWILQKRAHWTCS